jgi:hypothetical protein
MTGSLPQIILRYKDGLLQPTVCDGSSRACRRTTNARSEGHVASHDLRAIEQFGATTGLSNVLRWDPDRLTSEYYIDATALIRRSSWQAVGGYDVVVDECLGLQDYDFWLSLADEGRAGILVPEILARYRVPGDTMPATAALEIDPVRRYLKMRHRHLPWPQ